MFMDVTTNFGGSFIPTQADKLERGPVRLRSALQFSLNIPAIKATIMSGLDHVFERTKDFGLTYPKTALPVLSMGIGTLEVHPIDLLGAYGTIANGGVLMPHRVHRHGPRQSTGKVVWPTPDEHAEGQARDLSAEAAYIITDILAGNTDKKVNPFWGKWAIYDGKTRRPAAYKTGTTSDNRDVAAYGFLAPPADKKAPALAVGVWMGNSDNSPNDGKLSLDTSAPLWSAILTEVSKGMKIAHVQAAAAASRPPPSTPSPASSPARSRRRRSRSCSCRARSRRQKETIRVAASIDKATGLLWHDGCAGPKVTKGFFNLSEVESNFPTWQKANANWGARAARGSGVRGGPKGTRTAYFYNGAFAPFGRTWGAPFAPTAQCPLYTPPQYCDPFAPTPVPSAAEPPCIALPTPPPFGGPTNKPFPTRKPRETPRPR